MPAPTRILLTGGTGFVGRQILRALKEEGAWIRAISRRSLSNINADEVMQTSDVFQESTDWWASTLQSIDIVIHAAWYVEPGQYLTSVKNTECMIGSLRLADAFLKSNARHFVGIGSCFEYDLTNRLLDVFTPLSPSHAYTKSKVALFRALNQVVPIYEKSYSWHRLFYLYGEGEKSGRLVSNLHRHMQAGIPIDLTSGNQIRDFLDVRLAGDQIAKAALNGTTGPYNICSGEGRTIRKIAEDIADIYGQRELLRFGARADNPVDPPEIVGIPGNHKRPSN